MKSWFFQKYNLSGSFATESRIGGWNLVRNGVKSGELRKNADGADGYLVLELTLRG